ncbi:hypothetical protein AAHC03_0129 [Spirometra sp. Aus1]
MWPHVLPHLIPDSFSFKQVTSTPNFSKFPRGVSQCLPPPTPQRPPSLSLMPPSHQPHQQPRSPWMPATSIFPATDKAVSMPSPVGLGKPQAGQDAFSAFRTPSNFAVTSTSAYSDFGMFAPTNNRLSTMDAWQNGTVLRPTPMKSETECNIFKNHQLRICNESRTFQQEFIKNYDTTMLESGNLTSSSPGIMNQPLRTDECLRRRQFEASSVFENANPFLPTALVTTKESGLNIMYPTAVASSKASGWDNCDNQRATGLNTPVASGLIRSPIGKFNFAVDDLIVDDENQFHFKTGANFP